MSFHGLPCWYELASPDPAGSCTFYTAVLGWDWTPVPMPGMTYHLAKTPSGNVAGMMAAEPGQPAAWTIYTAVTDCDATAAQAQALGARVIVPPADIPGTGRFAILIDPQGAAFALLQPLPMEDGSVGPAFAPALNGHGNWQDLATPDPAAALAFYGALFGWTVARSVPMGPDMTYHVIAHGTQDIGGIFANGSQTTWKPYFRLPSASAAVAQIAALGGTVLHGPNEVPGGDFTCDARDPQGVLVAFTGAA
jgi:uncharacterized protein